YLQNGSLGRRVNIEARAYDDGVAFRYLVPPSAPLDEILIANEITEYRFAQRTGAVNTSVTVPFTFEVGGAGWVTISSSAPYNYAPMRLLHMEGGKIATLLDRKAGELWAVAGHTPFTTPWRIIAIGRARDAVEHSAILTAQ